MPSQSIKASASQRMSSMRNNDTWTDGLPRCKWSGVGFSQNQTYRDNGATLSEHDYEDRHINFSINHMNTFLYGIFDGHDGSKAADFVSQRMPAELGFEQLDGKLTGDEVKDAFRQAFISVENAFLESIDPKIAERAQLLEKIKDLSQLEAAQQYPDICSRLLDLEEEIRSGTTAVVALIHKDVLYIGNVGDSRALLCQKDKSGVLKVKQLTTDHTTNSADELDRLKNLGLDISKIKGGRSEFELLAPATSEPVICEPHINTVPIDDSCSFFLLMSYGLYKSYEEATGSPHVNKEIATMVVEQFLEQSTLTSVAQTVVDKVVRLHHDNFLTEKSNVCLRDDITLLIRNFNFHFPSNFQAQGLLLPLPTFKNRNISEGPESASSSDDEVTLNNISASLDKDALPCFMGPPRNFFASNDRLASVDEFGSTTSTDSSKLSNPSLTQLTLDEDGCIPPYVSFDLYFKRVDEAIANETIPRSEIHLYKEESIARVEDGEEGEWVPPNHEVSLLLSLDTTRLCWRFTGTVSLKAMA